MSYKRLLHFVLTILLGNRDRFQLGIYNFKFFIMGLFHRIARLLDKPSWHPSSKPYKYSGSISLFFFILLQLFIVYLRVDFFAFTHLRNGSLDDMFAHKDMDDSCGLNLKRGVDTLRFEVEQYKWFLWIINNNFFKHLFIYLHRMI